jgi:hypothetical protein
VHILFELQGIIRKQMKSGKNWVSTVCRHTAKRTKVLCRVQAHGKLDTCRSPVDLGVAWVDQMVTVPCTADTR